MQTGNSKNVLSETLILLGLGLLLALAANFLSPRGLSLTRNYFPSSLGQPSLSPANTTNLLTPTLASTASNPAAGGSLSPPPDAAAAASAAARLQAKGLRPLSGPETLALFKDPGYQQELVVFVDARDDRHYEAGHIPAAYHFDRYYPDKYLAAVLPPCLNAAQVVVYCTGGTCEDSEFAALALREAGVAPDHLAVFVGGINEWTTLQGPIELGARNSGNLNLNFKPTDHP